MDKSAVTTTLMLLKRTVLVTTALVLTGIGEGGFDLELEEVSNNGIKQPGGVTLDRLHSVYLVMLLTTKITILLKCNGGLVMQLTQCSSQCSQALDSWLNWDRNSGAGEFYLYAVAEGDMSF